LRLRCKGSYFFGICNTCGQVFYCFLLTFCLCIHFEHFITLVSDCMWIFGS
jgi:hypothetical protein